MASGFDDLNAPLCGSSQTHLGTQMSSGTVTSSKPVGTEVSQLAVGEAITGSADQEPYFLLAAWISKGGLRCCPSSCDPRAAHLHEDHAPRIIQDPIVTTADPDGPNCPRR